MPRQSVILGALGLCLAFPQLFMAQSAPDESRVIQAAESYLRDLNPVAIVPESVCLAEWAEFGNVDIGCEGQALAPETLVALGSVLDVPLLPARDAACSRDGGVRRHVLHFSPVTFDGTSARFIVRATCARGDQAFYRDDLVELERRGPEWVVTEVRTFSIT